MFPLLREVPQLTGFTASMLRLCLLSEGVVFLMLGLTCLPLFFRMLLRGLPGVFRYRHQLVFSWVLLMQIVAPARKTLVHFSRYTPSHIAEWHFRRLLGAGYWSVRLLLCWFAEEAIKSFPAPEDGVLYLIGDGSHKDKRGKKNPAAQKGKKSTPGGYFFGIKFVVVMVSWDVYRIPVDFEIVLPKRHKEYENENALFREMIQRFSPPDWVKLVVVLGDCAFGSKANMRLIQKKDNADKHRSWGFVFGIARTWKMANGKSLKNLVTHLPRKLYRKIWIPRLPGENRRKTFWVFAKRTHLRHLGEVLVVLSKNGRNVGPKKTKLLVTNLLELTARDVVAIYNRRWQIEILFKELKSGLRLGEHQVTKNLDRVRKSFAIGLFAYLLLIRARRKDIQPGQSWSIFQLQNNFTLEVIKHQLEHSFKLRIKNLVKAA